jgi:hypothetical protein
MVGTDDWHRTGGATNASDRYLWESRAISAIIRCLPLIAEPLVLDAFHVAPSLHPGQLGNALVTCFTRRVGDLVSNLTR